MNKKYLISYKPLIISILIILGISTITYLLPWDNMMRVILLIGLISLVIYKRERFDLKKYSCIDYSTQCVITSKGERFRFEDIKVIMIQNVLMDYKIDKCWVLSIAVDTGEETLNNSFIFESPNFDHTYGYMKYLLNKVDANCDILSGKKSLTVTQSDQTWIDKLSNYSARVPDDQFITIDQIDVLYKTLQKDLISFDESLIQNEIKSIPEITPELIDYIHFEKLADMSRIIIIFQNGKSIKLNHPLKKGEHLFRYLNNLCIPAPDRKVEVS